MEVLRISAPLEIPNFLTIGPIFHQFLRLEELHITRSNVPAIGHHSFLGVLTLRVINLTFNNICLISHHSFRGLSNLEKLHLDDNRIESMPSESFKYLLKLKVLTIARNKIHELVPRIFLNLENLQELDLSENVISVLNPEVFKDVKRVKVFRCRWCELSSLNESIYELLSELTILDLENNKFGRISSGKFDVLQKLEVLKLGGNQVSVLLDNSLTALNISSNLKSVSLSCNRLSKISSQALGGLTALRTLDLSYNLINNLDTVTFLPIAESLHALNLSGNIIPVNNLKFIIGFFGELKYLSLADMELSDVPFQLFSTQKNLKFLNLSGNRFSQLSPPLLTPISLIQTLDLSKNLIQGLNEKAMMSLERIPELFLVGNPWSCDLCHIPAILNRVNKTHIGSALKSLTCKTPHSLAGREVSTLEGRQLLWCEVIGVQSTVVTGQVQMGLLATVLASTMLIFFGVIMLIWIINSRCRTSHYYTREQYRQQSSHRLEHSSSMNDEANKEAYSQVSKTPRNNTLKVSIASIDELKKHPELQVTSNNI